MRGSRLAQGIFASIDQEISRHEVAEDGRGIWDELAAKLVGRRIDIRSEGDESAPAREALLAAPAEINRPADAEPAENA